MPLHRFLVLAALLQPALFPANLAISTYWKSGFTPSGIAADSQGNLYVAGSAIIDPLSQTTSAAVAKINSKAMQYVYLTYLDSAASDQISAIALDSAGNAYVAGSTTNPNFPVIGTASLGTPPANGSDARSFVTKLSPQGAVIFSVLIGGSAVSSAQGIAVTPQGQILVSGVAASKGFPVTPGAYSVTDSTNQWFLTELDATGSKAIFSATGIGGSSLAVDASGSIYMAGSSIGTAYPTTPGAYQTTFTQGFYCFGFCQSTFAGNLQHVTKTDPAASKLIYSTGLNDTKGGAGSTTNTGLAIDSAGNAYVTGTLFEGKYPFTVTGGTGATSFLTKLDPAGANAIFSVPVGGAGVQLDSSGALYVGGAIVSIDTSGGLPGPPPTVFIPPAFANVPAMCLPNFNTSISAAYAMKIDPASGAVQDSQLIEGSAPGATGIALAGGKVWITGPTPGPQVPGSPGALTPQAFDAGFQAGAYLSAIDFSTALAAGPSIACVLDAGNLSHAGPVAAFQLLSIFGSNLGPATGVSAPDGSHTSLGGVAVTFNGMPAQLLYVSASQINVAVPPPPIPAADAPQQSTAVMQVTYNGLSVQRQFAFTASNLNLFASLSTTQNPCPNMPSDNGFQPVATNADGSVNSCTNPAKAGSAVSLYAHGAGGFVSPPSSLVNLSASFGFGCTALVTKAALVTGFVYQVDVAIPSSLVDCGEDFSGATGVPVTLTYNNAPVAPLSIPANLAGPLTSFAPPGLPVRMIVWVTQ